MSAYDTGILMTNGFSIAAQKPADLKYLADTIADRDNYVTNNISYEGMLVYVKETKKVYQLIDNTWNEFGFNPAEFQANIYDGLDSDSQILGLSAKQGKILNQKITTHETNVNIHITAEEKATWNAKASTAVATQTADGLMSKSDKIKLDSIETGAKNYVHPETHSPSIIAQDANNRFVTDEQITYWNSKPGSSDDLPIATTTANGLMSSTDKINLNAALERIATLEENYESMLAKLKTAVFI